MHLLFPSNAQNLVDYVIKINMCSGWLYIYISSYFLSAYALHILIPNVAKDFKVLRCHTIVMYGTSHTAEAAEFHWILSRISAACFVLS
ncbi:hypothetical protein LIER_30785 [Lithospermum erythrorhizon]|uniref:Uncharacterized protein n=1 Tax=Lithospermum erythrorhizon TaxID=34254 RepID=A0AAV3RSV8_LITER